MTRLTAQGQPSRNPYFSIRSHQDSTVLELSPEDETSRLTVARVSALIEAVETLAKTVPPAPLIITGNKNLFSAGADLNEIAGLSASKAFEFAQLGQDLMGAIEEFSAPVVAAIEGYCMGGGLDLALACDCRIAAPNAIFGHRGAGLGLITGWGGTQRLMRLVGRVHALQMFVTAMKVDADHALRIGLIAQVHDDPVRAAVECAHRVQKTSHFEFSVG
jgi:enoyl-CoA hydratase